MGKYTKQDIVTMVAEEDVEFIRLQFVDIYGILKNVAVTASQLKRVLDNELTFDCGAIEGFENNNPVSYTHLDVYKRQALYSKKSF